ncbi:MAG: T9SS type A sorting domain-containing protein [Bacteroidota bacterium]|nr:MAG: T9SS type A sorting domain-containing protein [Bacteroidota bacterium]
MDTEVPGGKIYYRLRVEDMNGQEALSHSVFILKETFETTAQLFPNPGNGNATLRIQSASKSGLQIRCHDVTGRSMVEMNEPIQAGWNEISIPAENWPSGTYYIQVQVAGIIKVLKWVHE